MDDVGQTLLNWASAFGTLEMVLSFFICFFSLFVSLVFLMISCLGIALIFKVMDT